MRKSWDFKDSPRWPSKPLRRSLSHMLWIGLILSCLVVLSPQESTSAPKPVELSGLGTPVPPPPPATAIIGEVPQEWNTTRGTVVLFFSTLAKSTQFDIDGFAMLDERNTGIDIIAVSSETPQEIQALLQTATERPEAKNCKRYFRPRRTLEQGDS